MYQLTNDPDQIMCLDTGTLIPRGHRLWDNYAAYLDAGNSALPVPTPYEIHSPEHYRFIRSAAWAWMTAWVVDRRYDSIESCCSYFNSSVPRYREEARAMVAWRDAVNQELEALVLAAPAGIETWDQVRALLPQPEAFNWPGEVSLPLGTGESAVLE
ncbi:hypothetical protein [Stenotrophomonas maltophilia]|jgi:hypothetical protein|uniref:hypothetical protein n=1 Tax=Stenotrophomonas maltophilia TaxID=40324 RepID=UPI0035BCDC36